MDRAFHIREILWKAIYDFSFHGSWIAMGWVGTTRKSMWFQKKAGVCFQKEKKKKSMSFQTKLSWKASTYSHEGLASVRALSTENNKKPWVDFLQTNQKKKKRKLMVMCYQDSKDLKSQYPQDIESIIQRSKAKFIVICSFLSLALFRRWSRGWKVKEAATQRSKSWVEFNRECSGLRELRK